MRQALIVNGKFLSAPMTGVHRVAHELSNALAHLNAAGAGPAAELWISSGSIEQARAMRLPHRVVRPFEGIPWEQLSLPMAAQGRTLLNLCNMGPIVASQSVTMVHDAQVFDTPASYTQLQGRWRRAALPMIFRRHRHLLTVSHFSKQQFVRRGLAEPERIDVVHNGVDHILAVPAEPAVVRRLGLARRNYVVHIGSTLAHKNSSVLLQAFADPRLSGLTLLLVGVDSSSELARGVDVSRNVRFAGRVSDGELRALYEQALCIAVPSTTEGFGMPALEAMLVGCPAVVAPSGALPEVCGDAAAYADPHNPQRWIEAFEQLTEPSRWEERSVAGRPHAATFTWGRAAEKLVQVLQQVERSSAATGPLPQHVPA